MSETPTPQPDPSDLSDDTKKELIGIELEAALSSLIKDRERMIQNEMLRHGWQPDNTDKETQIVRKRVEFSYMAEESDVLLMYLDDRTGQAQIEEMGVLQDLDLLGEQMVDVRLDFDGQPGFVVEQVVVILNEESMKQIEEIRWTGYHLVDGKLHVVSMNIPIEELGQSDIEHQSYIHNRLAQLEGERSLGINDTECSITKAQAVTKIVKELRGMLAGYYAPVEDNSTDIANWPKQ